MTVSSQIVKARGARLDRCDRLPRGAGRPALYATTQQFLDDLGLSHLDQLPLLGEPGAAPAELGDLLSVAAPVTDADNSPGPSRPLLPELEPQA